MRQLPLFLAILAASLFGGCSLYHVRAFDDQNPNNGIPFFAASGACTQQTVRAIPYFLITLKISGASGVISSDTVKISKAARTSYEFNALLEELGKPQPVRSAVQTDWDNLKAKQPFDPYGQSDGEFVLSNTSKVVTVVNYSEHYSLNQKVPLAGTTSGDYKLSADGTLSEVQGQTQDNTLSTILTALSSLVQTAAGISAKAGVAAGTQSEEVHFSLAQEERMLTKTYSVTGGYTPYCPTSAALTEATKGVSVSLADVGANDASAKTQAPKDDSSIGITGTVSLPKGLVQPSQNINPNPPSGGKNGSGNTQGGGTQNNAGTKPKNNGNNP
jgi:hypothetical protein